MQRKRAEERERKTEEDREIGERRETRDETARVLRLSFSIGQSIRCSTEVGYTIISRNIEKI